MPETLQHPKKPRRNKMAQPPSKKLIRITDRTSDVQQMLQRKKAHVLRLVSADIDAAILVAAKDEIKPMTTQEQAYLVYMAAGCMVECILNPAVKL